ncbi:DUF998 domain-containing protein [Pontiella sulfatireligans]|uniref:Transglutaminase-like domain-containing protein n=1 Tax=Pontiella sulfatireligans TaxID=2750658 RepID=A0A6C2UIW2_9BACT|nr:transglutaminase domain-containing protein [Pontiella sulfatireligans]VGO20150.1 hypothetical protein SCARR_02211 [Pontiella sulfatireligans]
MTADVQESGKKEAPSKPKWKGSEVRPLTTDERASFIILSLYMAVFCICMFVYWDSLVLKIAGVTVGSAGVFLFVAAFFNTEAPEKSHSIHPVRSYLFSFFFVLASLFTLRFLGGLITNFIASVVVLYAGLLASLILFRKAMVQVVTAMLAIVFLFVTVHNWHDVLGGRFGFKDAVRQCGQAVFRIGPIQDVANMLIAGTYVTYLGRVDYRDEQINILAIRQVLNCRDDELLKTKALLDFVSNEIHYVSDPDDGFEHAKDPINTLIAGGGDCEDQTLVLCSLLESVGVKTYIAFTDEHVFALVRFSGDYPKLPATPHVFIDGRPCYALDPADPGAVIGFSSAAPEQIKRVFDVRRKSIERFSLQPSE